MMEFQSEVGQKSKDQKNEMAENSNTSCSRPRTKLRDILMHDKPASLSAHFHHEITRNAGLRISKSSERQQSRGPQGKAREDEMLQHVSKSQSHLEKGNVFQEKPQAATSLDWRHLEKLYKHNPVPNKNSGHSPSTSSSSYFSTDGSSSNSSRGNSSSPAHLVTNRSPSQSHLETLVVKNYIRDDCYSVKGSSPARRIAYHVVPQSHQPKHYQSQGRAEDVKKFRQNAAYAPSHKIRQHNSLSILDQNSTTFRSGIKLDTYERKASDSNTTSESGKQQIGGNPELAPSLGGKMRIQGSEMKEEIMQSHEPNLDCLKEHQVLIQLPRDPSHLSDSVYKIPGDNVFKNLSRKDNVKEFHSSDIYSSVLHSCPLPSTDNGSGNRKSEVRESCSMAATQGVKNSSQQFKSPSRTRDTVDMKLITGLKSSSAIKLSGGFDKRPSSESTSKARQSSPIRRLSYAVGSFIRSAGSRENSPLRRSNPKDHVPRPESDRTKSSPLRRLLDPLLKSKAPNTREVPQPSKKEQPVIVKEGPSLIQALLQVSIKNGLPLFTFAVDNDSDILAATLRKLSQEKNGSSWIYTFFTVHETKRNSGLWLNHGTKGNGHSYVPNVIAQMKVSNPQFPVNSNQKGMDSINLREFNLFSVDTDQVDQHATEFQPTNELAAIVAKILKPASLVNTTVILPGDVHTIPSKGPISTLTQRWRSGGSCDCGGWDVGCQLRIFKQDECGESSNPDEYKLFNQDGQETELVMSLKPYKDRIYSVEFDSSISLLQAFATSVSVLDCRRSSGFFADSNVFEGRASTTVNVISDDLSRMKLVKESQGEAHAGHSSYPPPHSPVISEKHSSKPFAFTITVSPLFSSKNSMDVRAFPHYNKSGQNQSKWSLNSLRLCKIWHLRQKINVYK